VDTRWVVLSERPEFFAITKRLHNKLHGHPGDGGSLGAAEREAYEEILEDSAHHLTDLIKPGDVVLPDQFIDLTKRRMSTFFEGGIVAHVAFGDPVCPSLGAVLLDATRAVGATVHQGGVYLCIEGPQFSTKGESRLYRQWGVSVIGMTNLPEAKLAREAELCYATVALATDYDCWHETEDAVTVESILATLRQNVSLAKRLLRAAIPKVADGKACICQRALQDTIITAPDRMPASLRRKLALLMDRAVPAKKGAR